MPMAPMASMRSASWTIIHSRVSGATESVPLNDTWEIMRTTLSCISAGMPSDSMKRRALA